MNNILSEKDTVAIQDIIIRQLDVQRDQLMPEARILADLGADSLDVVEISMALEELFDVTILMSNGTRSIQSVNSMTNWGGFSSREHTPRETNPSGSRERCDAESATDKE